MSGLKGRGAGWLRSLGRCGRRVGGVVTLGVVLAGCGTPPKVAAPRAELRAPNTPIYSAAAFDARQITGLWRQVALVGAAQPLGCGTAVGVRVQPLAAGGLGVDGALCLDGRVVPVTGELRAAGPGRLAVAGMADWWVLWVDSGYRTLAIGTPSGSFGFVLDRGGISHDRLAAAREIFEFNGYRAAWLRPL